jgi:hypothetical protein
MPNNVWTKAEQLDSNGRFVYTYTADQANSPNNWMILNTQNTFVDKNIFIQAIVPAGVLSSGGTIITTNISSDASSLLTEVETAPSSGPYVTVSSSGSVSV